jgi:pimeloyl-ACP methyl ester carboxylesterase
VEDVERPWRIVGPATRLAVVALLALLIAACGAPIEPVPDDEERRVQIDGFETTFTQIRDRGATAIGCDEVGGGSITVAEFVGRTAEGATYFHYTPNDGWNGELVVYARGYVPTGMLSGLVAAFLFGGDLPDRVQEIVDLRDALLCSGYAFALSAYASAGYAVEEGFRDTHLLNALFAWHGEEPTRTFVVGHSMGALIATALIESFPARYEGGLATCGPVGGSLLQMDYIGNVRVVFDHLFPGVIEGNVLTPTEQSFEDVVAAIEMALADADPEVLELLAEMRVTGLVPDGVHDAGLSPGEVRLLRHDPGVAEPELEGIGDAIGRALFYEVVGKEDALARGDGGLSFDNLGVAYLPDDPLLDGIGDQRYSGHPAALDYFGDWYVSGGALDRPLRLVHSEFDADVPAYHVAAYLAGLDAFSRDRVDAVIIVGDTSHCVMQTAELLGHFQELLDAATP